MDLEKNNDLDHSTQDPKPEIERWLDIVENSLFKGLNSEPLTLNVDEREQTISNMCKQLSQAFSDIFTKYSNTEDKLDISFDVVNTNGKEKFFGVRIFPSIGNLEQICRAMIVAGAKIDDLHEMWRGFTSWYIELDDNMFDRQQVMMTPQEIIALILQAWCNTYIEYTPLDRFVESCKEWFYVKPLSNNPNPDPFYEGMHSLSLDKKEKIKLMHLLFTIPLWVSCKFPDILKESPSKSVLVYKGSIFKDGLSGCDFSRYGDIYVPTVGKLVKTFGSTFDGGEEFTINTVGYYVRWALQNAVDNNRRYHNMKDDLLHYAHLTSGHYAAALMIKILNDFGIGLRENYTGAVLESAQFEEVIENRDHLLDNYTALQVNPHVPIEAAYEALIHKKNKTVKEPMLPSDYDIDTIGIEVDRISNHHDRVYVLDLIYHKIEEIQAVMLYWDQDSNRSSSRASRVKIKGEQQLKLLSKYRDAVMRKRSFNSDYKVFVKVPEGYEG